MGKIVTRLVFQVRKGRAKFRLKDRHCIPNAYASQSYMRRKKDRGDNLIREQHMDSNFMINSFYEIFLRQTQHILKNASKFQIGIS